MKRLELEDKIADIIKYRADSVRVIAEIIQGLEEEIERLNTTPAWERNVKKFDIWHWL